MYYTLITAKFAASISKIVGSSVQIWWWIIDQGTLILLET